MTSCSTNRFVISKSKIKGYLAIYFMLISNQSNFSEIYMTPYRTVIMAGLRYFQLNLQLDIYQFVLLYCSTCYLKREIPQNKTGNRKFLLRCFLYYSS